MTTHQFNPNSPPDDEFVKGELKYLVVGNECRLLDRRRTPGVIVAIDIDGGFFRWEISDFEDMGKYWDVAFERVETYQFKHGSLELSEKKVDPIRARITELGSSIEVQQDKLELSRTNKSIENKTDAILNWFVTSSEFFRPEQQVDFQSRTGPELLRKDFNRYMLAVNLSEIESRTADIQVMNPHSGDWIKGVQIVMAEMGLKSYQGGQVRSKTTFSGLGSKSNLRNYIEHRLGFIRAFFKKIGQTDVELYRGMSTEWDWKPDVQNQYRFWSSWTFNYQVAKDFSDLSPGTKQKNSYLIKRAIPADKLFMTFLETDAMNRQYSEAEALVLHADEDRMLW